MRADFPRLGKLDGLYGLTSLMFLMAIQSGIIKVHASGEVALEGHHGANETLSARPTGAYRKVSRPELPILYTSGG